MPQATTSTYALLALLRLQPWTGYELTRQARRSLRFAWPRSEAHLYTEQKRLVRLGWATERKERVGRRSRNRYEITAAGGEALRTWLTTEPAAPRFEIEGILRLLFAEYGTLEDLRGALDVTARHARAALDDGLDQARDYLATGGPFPERLNLIALAATWFADSLALLEEFCLRTSDLVADWDRPLGPAEHREARQLLAQLVDRHGTPPAR